MSERWRKFQLLVVRFIVWLTQSWLWRKFTLLALRFIVWLDPSLVDRKIRETARAGALKYGRSELDRKSTRLNSSHGYISYAVFCLKKKKIYNLLNHHEFRTQQPEVIATPQSLRYSIHLSSLQLILRVPFPSRGNVMNAIHTADESV